MRDKTDKLPMLQPKCLQVETRFIASHMHQLKVLVGNQTVPGLVEKSKDKKEFTRLQ